MKPFNLIASFLLASCSLFSQDVAEQSQPQHWIDRMAASAGRPAEFDMEMTMNMEMMQMEMTMAGHMLLANQTHLRGNIAMDMESPMMPGGKQHMDMVFVGDGTDMWIEISMTPNPMGGDGPMLQVIKMSFEAIQKMGDQAGKAAGMNFGFDPTNSDIAAQAAKMFETIFTDVEVEVKDGNGILSGAINTELDGLGQQFQMLGVDRFTYVVDGETGYPIASTMGNEEGDVLRQTVSNLKFHDLKKMDMKVFKYEVPEGVQVMDMSAMLTSMSANETGLTEPSEGEF